MRERAPVCLGPSETAALLMAVCRCVRLEDVLFLVPRDGNNTGTRAGVIVRSQEVILHLHFMP